MSLTSVTAPYPTFTDSRGRIISIGQVYIGVVDEDPETDPISVYWDSAGTIVAAQPLDIINGYVCRAGTPAQFFTNSDYSIRLYDNTHSVVYYYPAILAKTIDGAAGGVLTGSYPNPGLADASVTNGKIADNAVLNSNIVPGSNSTLKGTMGSVVTDIDAYTLNGILDRVGKTEYSESSIWDTNLYYWMNGATISRITDARLFAKVSALLGTQGALGWGVGDGSTTFVLPDRRGMFNRAFATNGTIDPDGGSRVVGSKQLDAFQGHIHATDTEQAGGGAAFGGFLDRSGVITPVSTGGPLSDGSHGTPRISTETRPINAATYWLVVR